VLLLPLVAGLAMGCVVGEVYALRKDTKSLTAPEWEVRWAAAHGS
jgi:hypothetical protein